MMDNIVIHAEKLGKKYHIGHRQQAPATLRAAVMAAMTAPLQRLRSAVRNQSANASDEIIWALKDVSLDIQRGETVGIIGRNGAGKSTLLKILTRITKPTEGRARIYGRVGSLLEVGTGFHPDLTGRENVYLNGVILGMTRPEINRKFDEILAFAGVEQFIDTPVKFYSSGMKVRLAFSVAAHLEPEVLLIDEVLAVGDAPFQKKCLGKMDDIAHQGRTVLFVSHTMEAITGLCSRAIWLDKGHVKADGLSKDIVRAYLTAVTEQAASVENLGARTDRSGDGHFRFTGFAVQRADGTPVSFIASGDTVDLALAYEAKDSRLSNVSIWIWVCDASSGRKLMCFWTGLTGEDFEVLPSKGVVICRVPRFPLIPGTYTIGLGARRNNAVVDDIANVTQLEVVPGDFFGSGRKLHDVGEFLCDHSWRVAENTEFTTLDVSRQISNPTIHRP